MTKQLDFLERLKDQIDSLGLYASCRIGRLGAEDSLSLMAMPGGDETVYFDGARDKAYHIQVNAKSSDPQKGYEALSVIFQTLENLGDLPSQNSSYEFGGITVSSLPSFLHQDEQGYFIHVLSIIANITIYQGVNIQYA